MLHTSPTLKSSLHFLKSRVKDFRTGSSCFATVRRHLWTNAKRYLFKAYFHWQYSPLSMTPYRRSPALSTLNPDKLLPSDFSDVSDRTVKYIYFAGAPRVPLAMQPKFGFHGASGRFPDHARGFLYFHNPSNTPLVASAIRLRCTPSKDPATFNQGKDLEGPHGIPWEFTFPSIILLRSPYIRDYLVQTGLVTADLVSHWRSVLKAVPRTHNRVLYQLNQPFLIKFHHQNIILPVAVPDFAGSLIIQTPFHDHCIRPKGSPYKGSLPMNVAHQKTCLTIF